VITKVREEELLWVYFFNSEDDAKSGDFFDSLVGNAPIIVDRSNGKLYSTGTAFPVDHYIQEFLAGTRRPIAMPQQ
jgi:hypothetical protein